MKKYIHYLLLPVFVLMSCNNQQEGRVQAKDSIAIQPAAAEDKASAKDTQQQTPQAKQLRYMYAANGALIGFFDDGSVSGCPRCDMIKENVSTLYETPPHAHYEAHKNYLLVNGDRMDFYDKGVLKREWVLFDYKWTIDIFPRK